MKRALICALVVLGLGCIALADGDIDNVKWFKNTNYTSPEQPYSIVWYAHLDSAPAWRDTMAMPYIAFTVYTAWRYLGDGQNGFQYIGRLFQIDTTYDLNDNDTVDITIQTTHNPNSPMSFLTPAGDHIYDIHVFAAVADTGNFFVWFPPDSASVQTQTPWVRTKVDYSAWQDSASSTLDVNQHVSDIGFEEYIAPIRRY